MQDFRDLLIDDPGPMATMTAWREYLALLEDELALQYFGIEDEISYARKQVAMRALHVRKVNKRLCVVDAEGGTVYVPPDFLRLTDRAPLEALARRLEDGYDIRAISEFESSCPRR